MEKLRCPEGLHSLFPPFSGVAMQAWQMIIYTNCGLNSKYFSTSPFQRKDSGVWTIPTVRSVPWGIRISTWIHGVHLIIFSPWEKNKCQTSVDLEASFVWIYLCEVNTLPLLLLPYGAMSSLLDFLLSLSRPSFLSLSLSLSRSLSRSLSLSRSRSRSGFS